jgi:hypothetical protein
MGYALPCFETPIWNRVSLQRIAIFTAAPRWPLARQTAGRSLQWGDCRFVINPRGGRFDGCIVYDALLSEVAFEAPPDRVVLVTGEPPSIKSYNEQFAAQFSAVVTCHTDLPHPRLILMPQGQSWIAGFDKNASDLGHAAKDLDAFLSETQPEKTRLISVVVSDKAITHAHKARRTLVAALQKHFGSELHVFGRGVRDIGDKADALRPFKYHIALENSSFFHYWTEKISDPFLYWSLPFYWGCPNIGQYFPDRSFININIYDIDYSISTIEAAINSNIYSKSLPVLTAARRRVLLEYNLFAAGAKLLAPPSEQRASVVRLRPEQVFRDRWTRKVRHRLKRALPRKWRKTKVPQLGAPLPEGGK